MADISAVFVSIDIYSSTLDKLIKKTDEAVNKLLKVTATTKKAISDMNKASNMANQAADKFQKSTSGVDKMVKQMSKVGKTTLDISNKLKATGASADNAAGKFQKATTKLNEAVGKIQNIGNDAKKAADKVSKAGIIFDKFKTKIVSTKNSLTGWMDGKLKKAFSLDSMKNGIKVIDDMARASAKLSVVNDGSQTNEQLKEKIFAASGRSRGSSVEMIESVKKLELTTGDVFKTNDETIAFTELAQKSFVAGGGSKEERSSAMTRLTDSMATGGLKGTDLSALSQTAPAIMEAISSYTGVSGEKLIELADQGKITADVIKNAMFASCDQINASFADAPMTFEDSWSMIKEGGLQAFSEIMEKITNLISMPEFSVFINGLIVGIGLLASGISWVIETIVNGWNIIGPVLGAAAIAILAVMTAHVLAMAVSWMLAALPILLIISLIIGVIAIAMSMGATIRDVVGFIGSIIGGLVTIVYNVCALIMNIFIGVVNFMVNAFSQGINKIKIFINNILIFCLDKIEKLVSAVEPILNKIPGININFSGDIANMKNNLIAKNDDLKSNTTYTTVFEQVDYKDVLEGANAGKNIATGAYDKGMDFISNINQPMDLPYTPFDNTGGGKLPVDITSSVTPSNPLPIEGTGTGGAVNVEMPEDDLDYLREIAERDYIANVATNSLAPNISIQFGDVHENADADKLAARISEILQNEIAMASEGVY